MKKFLTAIGTSLLVAMMVACNLANGLPTLGNRVTPIPGHVLVGVAQNAKDSFPGYRAVYPQEWGDAGEVGKTSKADLEYSIYLYDSASTDHGIPTSGVVFNGFSKVKWSDIRDKKSFIDVPTGTTSLIMVATKGTKRVLISGETKIVVPGPNYINFVLEPYRATQADAEAAEPGKVAIKFIYYDPVKANLTNVDKVSIELKKNGGVGTDIPTVEFTAAGTSKIETYEGADEKRIQMVQYKQDTVVPGIYNFIAKLFKNNVEFATATDIVVVDPANLTTKVIKIDTDLDVPPSEPINFRVAYTRPAKTDTTYSATFTWQDTSYNEEHFYLSVLDGTTPLKVNGDPGTGPIEIDANKENQKITGLVLGKKYTAMIYAENKYGKSSEVKFNDVVTGENIHLARIIYNLECSLTSPASYGIAVHDENNLLSIKEESAGTHDYVSYYSVAKNPLTVQLPGPVGLPYVYCPSATQRIDLRGYLLNGETDPTKATFELPVDSSADVTAKAVWTLHSGLAPSFPFYSDYCTVKGGTAYIKLDLPATSPAEITHDFTIQIATLPDYKVESVVTKLNAVAPDPATATVDATPNTTVTTATSNVISQNAKITFKKAGSYNVLFEVTLVHKTDTTKKRITTATCAVIVQ